MTKRKRERLVAPDPSEKVARSVGPETRALEFLNRSEGRQLEPGAQAYYDARFGHDFANVRIHAEGEAARAAEGVDAKAFTVGSDIVFNQGVYPPRSVSDSSVLAHELAHAVQNERQQGPSPGAASGVATRSGPADPAEADASRAARAIVSGGRAQVSAGPSALIAAQPKMQDVTVGDMRQAAAEEWVFNHDDVDWGATEKEKKRTAKSLTSQPRSAGAREQELAHEGSAALSEMSLYDTTRAEGGARIKQFEQAYAVFRLPMQMTLGSLGRVQDLLTAGAPQTPGEMSKEQRKIFQRLGENKAGNQNRDVFGRWADQTANMNMAMDGYMAVYQRLQGALQQWRGMKERILRRQKQAQLARDTAKLAKLEAPAKLVVSVIEVFQGGISAYEQFKPEALAASEPDVDLARAESETDIDIRTGSQKVASGGGKAKAAISKSAGLVGLTVETVFNWATGKSDEISALENTIQRLKTEIEAAGERAEDFDIDAARLTLAGVGQEKRTAALNVGTTRVKAREASKIYAGVMAGENVDARLLTLCAGAYQELRMFAEKALEAYRPVAAALPAVQKFISQPGKQYEIGLTRAHRRAADELGEPKFFDNDYESLMDAAGTARTYGALLKRELPEWQKRAGLWSNFFEKQTGSRLDEYGEQRKGGGG